MCVCLRARVCGRFEGAVEATVKAAVGAATDQPDPMKIRYRRLVDFRDWGGTIMDVLNTDPNQRKLVVEFEVDDAYPPRGLEARLRHVPGFVRQVPPPLACDCIAIAPGQVQL